MDTMIKQSSQIEQESKSSSQKKVGRNVVDNFETALRRQKYEKGYIVAFSFTRGAHEEVARVKKNGLEIKLIKVEDLLYGKVKI